jgi:outer membrane translocation and assembly module TamA
MTDAGLTCRLKRRIRSPETSLLMLISTIRHLYSEYRVGEEHANPPTSVTRLTGALAVMLLLSGVLGPGCASARANKELPRTELCPGFIFVGKVQPGLSDTEKRLVCGDPKSDAWKVIPKNQAKFMFSTFMQDRALYHVQYVEEKERVTAEVGDPLVATSLTSEGEPSNLELSRQRRVVGEKLTPSLLDTIEQWTKKRLGSIGYPCPKVTSHANSDTGEIHLVIEPGPQQDLMAVQEVNIPGVAPGVLRRYDAFRLGKAFNADNLVTTSNRIVNQGLFDSSFFVANCTDKGAVANQEVVSSPPHLLSLGVGLNTEEILVGRARWTVTRLGKNASDVSVQIYTSFRSQQLSSYYDAYVFDPGSRQAIRPYISIDHENWDAYETGTFSTQLAHETTWDGENTGFKVITGPQLDVIRTYRAYAGVAPVDSHFLSLMSSLTLMTHAFEYYSNANSPRTGYAATASVGFADQSAFSTTSVQRIDLRWEGLWNYRHYDPPLFVFGLRAGYDTTISSERPNFADPGAIEIPPTYLHFLGGSQDLRGFGVQELPLRPQVSSTQTQIGNLSSAFLSFEARLVAELPFNLQPIFFTDVGALGNIPGELFAPIYWDPGIGLRLQSPIGVVRGTLAHGFIGDTPDHFQLYFSYGQEF